MILFRFHALLNALSRETTHTDFSMALLGPNSAEKRSLYYALTYHDFPSMAINRQPKKAAVGTSTTVGLKVEEV